MLSLALLNKLKGLSEMKKLIMLSILLLLGSCQSSSNYTSVNESALDDVEQSLEQSRIQSEEFYNRTSSPEAVMESLVPGLTLNAQALKIVEERFDFAVPSSMDVREFFSLLTSGTDYSILVHPNVSGDISALDLKNVTIEEAMEQIKAIYGFNINKNGNIYQVMPSGMETRIFHVNYLNVTRNGQSNMQITSVGITDGGGGSNGLNGINGINGGINGGLNGVNGNLNNASGLGGLGGVSGSGNSGGASINTTTEADYWEGLEEIIARIVNSGARPQSGSGGLFSSIAASSSEERSVIVSPQTGMIVVHAYPSELDKVGEFLAASQSALQRQVVLEAKILEVELKEGFQSGIDLNTLGDVANSLPDGPVFRPEDNEIGGQISFLGESLDGISSPLALNFNFTDFAGVIQLLETQGNVQVISSPRISTLNNQKAVFKVGEEEYFLTNANSTSFGAGEQQTTNQNTNLQPFFSGIALDVTPQISEMGDIILHIHPILSTVVENIKVIGGQEFPLANSSTRESDSIARARNGEVVVISGLMQTRSRGSSGGVPGVREVPLLGNAFEQTQNELVKTELVILLRALVDEDDLMQSLINEHSENINNLRQRISQ